MTSLKYFSHPYATLFLDANVTPDIMVSVYVIPLNFQSLNIACLAQNWSVRVLGTFQTAFWVVTIIIVLAQSTPNPHICADFLASNFVFWLPISNPFSFTLVWFNLAIRKSLIFCVKLSTVSFVHEAAVLLDCWVIVFLLLLLAGFLGSL